MTCRQCGMYNNEGAKYCTYCGYNLSVGKVMQKDSNVNTAYDFSKVSKEEIELNKNK